MQHDKNTKKIEQIAKVSKNAEEITQTISEVSDTFAVKDILKKFDTAKRAGQLVSTLTISLLILPFLGVASVAALFKSGLNKAEQGQKNAYYDVKNNEKISWRFFLISMAQRFKFLISESNDTLSDLEKMKSIIKAIIFDDTTLEKTGKHIEGVGYIYDHVKNIHILGFKLLVCGFYDGSSFIPIDFYLIRENRKANLKKKEKSLNKKQAQLEIIITDIKKIRARKKTTKKEIHNLQQSINQKITKTKKKKLEQKKRVQHNLKIRLSKKISTKKSLSITISELEIEHLELKSKHCGLSKKEYSQQFKKKRKRNSCGYKRKNESNHNKIDAAIKMLKHAVKKGFIPDYVITDSWFFCKKLLDAVINTGRSVQLVSMAKIGTAKYNILPDKKILNPHEIITLYQRKKGRNSRKYKARYIQLNADYQGVRVKIFLIKFGTHSKWRMLVTTDLSISFTRIIEVYQIRWTIEVFFKECKQYLHLGKCQSQDFDAQIADITLSFVRYIYLSYYERIHYGITIGGIFRKLSQASIKESLLSDISFYFFELLQIFANRIGIDFFAFYEGIINDPEANDIILKMGINPNKKQLENV